MSQQKAVALFSEHIDASILEGRTVAGVFHVTTLGPAGTSSEGAANYLVEKLRKEIGLPGRVTLHNSFEGAADAVLTGKASAVVVANAYSKTYNMYMNPQLTLAGAFIQNTPPYGIAAANNVPIPLEVRITTHPSPIPLIQELLPSAFLLKEIIPVSSTSEAARSVAEGEVDLALTNESSAARYHLRFVSSTRPIQMLWSVFVRREPKSAL